MTVAGLVNALKVVNKTMEDAKITLVGAGSANVCTARMLLLAGADPRKMMIVDSRGILSKERGDIEASGRKEKWELALATNGEGRGGGIAEARAGEDVLIALSKSGPDVIKKEWIAKMGHHAIVFACANPIPEIWPWEAKEAGASIVATGRSDFPNQVNNSIGFPAIFRGALDVMARTITDEMCIAASFELARYAEENGLSAVHILPSMDEWAVFPRVAVAVGRKAIEQDVARLALGEEELFATAEAKIRRAREEVSILMEKGIIERYRD